MTDPNARADRLYVDDPQLPHVRPLPEVIEAAGSANLRLTEVLQTLVDGYADRPALGRRARELVTDPDSGRTSVHLLPAFETISYREVWDRAAAVATALRNDGTASVRPGHFIATIGFASPDYFTVDLACNYLGLVAVPLQHNAPVAQLRPIIAETEPKVVAVGAEYLDLAVESALASQSLRHLLVCDFDPDVDDHRDAMDRATNRFREEGKDVVVDTLARVIERGANLPTVPPFTEGDDDRLAMVMYTSGSTGAPKGAMLTERTIATLFTSNFVPPTGHPVLNVNFMPLNHVGGRLPIMSAFVAGGTSYFVAKPDLSTLFEDWQLVRPTELALVPRVVDMLFQHYRSAADRLTVDGEDVADAEAAAATEVREHILGGRVLNGFVSTAPLAAEMKEFIDGVLGVHITDGYGTTEVGGVTRDGLVMRPPVIDYKLVDVPELGYFLTDKPHPRGELLVKTVTMMPGYYKRPEVTDEVFDADGFYRTGDVMAEIEPDRLAYVDRSKNVLKLSQGEFVAVANLEAIFASAPLVRQIFVYGDSRRPNLLAVVVPTPEALLRFGEDTTALKAALTDSLRAIARDAQLQTYEVPVDFLIETEPFTAANGLLSGVGKILRPRLKEHYGERLEQMYAEIAATRVDELRLLREQADQRPVLDSVLLAAQTVLGTTDVDVDPDDHFTALGGDSLSALTFGNLLRDLFGVDVPVGVIVGPTSYLRQLADYIETERESSSHRPTFASVHGQRATAVRAADLTLDKFIDADTLAAAPSIAYVTGEPTTVLLTGANGWLGRFLALELLERAALNGGTVITIVRGRDEAAAMARLEAAFDSDRELLGRFRRLAADHLEVVAGDIGEPNLGLPASTWDRLANNVDQIIHPAALVNHVLPYSELFGPNVVGTAEIIRLAITAQIKPVTYLSTVAVAMSVAAGDFAEDGDIRDVSPVRPVDSSYANGYANSKWAGEVLLREAHDLCGLPVAVFRSDMILAHNRYAGQLNVPDAFTRLVQSLLLTGVAPETFYERDAEGRPQHAHYDGLPVDFVAESIVTLAATTTDEYRSYDVMNPHDDNISLDTFVDWLNDAGHPITRIRDYDDWLHRFETALNALPEAKRRHSVLPLLDAYRKPERPVRGAIAPTDVFRTAVRAAKIGAAGDIPHITAALISKYVADLKRLELV